MPPDNFEELLAEANASLLEDETKGGDVGTVGEEPAQTITPEPPVAEPVAPATSEALPPREGSEDHEKQIRQLKLQEAKARRLAKQTQEKLDKAKEFQKLWEDAVQDGKDPRKLVEKLTGKQMDEIINQELLRKARWEQATPEEREAIEAQAKTKELEERVRLMEEEKESYRQQLSAEQQDAYKQRVMSVLDPTLDSFAKSIKDFAPTAREAGEMVDMVMSKSLNDFKRAVSKGYNLTPSNMKKIVENNTKLFTGGVKTIQASDQTQQQVQQQQNAQNAAAAASQANYGPDAIGAGLEKASHTDILNALFPED